MSLKHYAPPLIKPSEYPIGVSYWKKILCGGKVCVCSISAVEETCSHLHRPTVSLLCAFKNNSQFIKPMIVQFKPETILKVSLIPKYTSVSTGTLSMCLRINVWCIQVMNVGNKVIIRRGKLGTDFFTIEYRIYNESIYSTFITWLESLKSKNSSNVQYITILLWSKWLVVRTWNVILVQCLRCFSPEIIIHKTFL